MSRVRIFISYDVDHDNDLKTRLIDQADLDGSLFGVDDWSIREGANDWEDKARKRVSNVDLILVVCGEHTGTAAGVNNEITLAREAGQPYLLLDGRPGRSQKPQSALAHDKIIGWNPGTWQQPVGSRGR